MSSCEKFTRDKLTSTKIIMNKLEQAGYRTFLNTDSDVKKIEISLLNASCMILCITQTFSVDEFCRFEAAEAIKQNKPIIPVILKDRMVLDQEKEWLLEMIIPNQPYVWFEDGLNEEGFKSMFEKLKRILPMHSAVLNEPSELTQMTLRNEIDKLNIKKRRCFKIVSDPHDSL